MKKMDLVKCFNIQDGDIVSIVGVGGKSTLITYLGETLGGKTLLMPSTKMYRPKTSWSLQLNKKIEWQEAYEIDETVITAGQEIQEKLIGINPFVFNGSYDHLLIEADGSKGMSLKGWRSDEPLVIKETTLTIGIIDISALGMPINVSTIHRLPLFKDLTQTTERVSLENLVDIIGHPKGLFKDSCGKRVLFINKVESHKSTKDALKLCKLLELAGLYPFLNQVIIGSIHNAVGTIRE